MRPLSRIRSRWPAAATAVLVLASALTGAACSVRKLAVNKVGNALAEGGESFASDDDPELIEVAMPFSLKLMESLVAESTRHRGLLEALAGGFTRYSFAFVQSKADEMSERDLDGATVQWERAKRLYLRARDYGIRGLEVEHAGITEALGEDPAAAVAGAEVSDVPLLYWTAVSWTGAVSLATDDPDLLGDLPIVEALIQRALELDEDYDHGAIHSFLIQYEMGRPGAGDDAVALARRHFDRAMELTAGELASPLVALAEAVAIAEQDRAAFESLLSRALAVDSDARPEWRMSNLIYQRRARWLLERVDQLILD